MHLLIGGCMALYMKEWIPTHFAISGDSLVCCCGIYKPGCFIGGAKGACPAGCRTQYLVCWCYLSLYNINSQEHNHPLSPPNQKKKINPGLSANYALLRMNHCSPCKFCIQSFAAFSLEEAMRKNRSLVSSEKKPVFGHHIFVWLSILCQGN